jgi:PAS domain S-box-containing protein
MAPETPSLPHTEDETRAGARVLRIVLVYAVFAALWILFSDQAVEHLLSDPADRALTQSFKGLLFVAVTSLLLWGLIRRLVGQIQTAARREQQVQVERLRALGLLDAIAAESSDAIFAKDAAGRYLLFNREAARVTGKSPDEAIGQDDTSLFPPDQAALIQANDRRVMADNRSKSFQEEVSAADGERTFLATKGPLRDETGRVVGMFGISRDITEIKQAERALRSSEGRFRALVEESLAGIYIIQGDYFRYVNPGFATLFGYGSPADVIDRVRVADLVSPADRELVAENLRRRLEGGARDTHYSFVGLRCDGLRLDVEVHGRVFDYQGHPAVIGLLLDITARKVAEEALAWQTRELRERNEELERFNRVTVGREMDMITLKQQVNALSRQLGQAPPFSLDFLDAPLPPATDTKS